MNKSISNLCLTAVIAFIVGSIIGITIGTIALNSWRSHKSQKQREQRGEAVHFFYRTMNDLFEGIYNPQEGTIYKDALKEFREYESRLGNKCMLFIGDANPSYYEGTAVFSSGDCFYVYISRTDERYEIIGLQHKDWDQIWKEILYRNHIKQKK